MPFFYQSNLETIQKILVHFQWKFHRRLFLGKNKDIDGYLQLSMFNGITNVLF
jgi:hypothetical protein